MHASDARLHSPAAERNTAPILAQLQALLPAQGLMLEIASGTGQHAAAFSHGLPGWQWQPTDYEASALASINAWCAGLERVRPAVQLDVLRSPWPSQLPEVVDAMFCANMIHIAPWACTGALMQGAARHLSAQGLLITYGPYLEEATPTAPGNLAFDMDLRSRNPAWGLRQLHDVVKVAGEVGLRLRDRISMPVNNLLLVWTRV
ncbi:MAG: DUF938 domain-containing protein [Curvibacter lanceolatus]|jgi:hypothetical protein|uniref:DUF938 domain-containing protein n=1 Tax=Curvibacter lanceolatus TaxID=86182 RepID=UPI0004CEFC41|nr:DUF938 domain-containing protein [Curvibacter lanceolatus]MBV5293528.1 DUF938 domain-containing protein [Curvibacter lanceolatus]